MGICGNPIRMLILPFGITSGRYSGLDVDIILRRLVYIAKHFREGNA
ncbi:hypothetical protein OROMI_022849 [Orobanche minor]